VRGIQAYQEGSDRARAGHSSAINLADVDHHAADARNVAATAGFFRGVRMIGAQVTALAALDRPVADRTQVRLHIGTAEVLGELVLLDRDALAPGETGLAQLRLGGAVVVRAGRPLRAAPGLARVTLGGGVVLEESQAPPQALQELRVEELSRAALVGSSRRASCSRSCCSRARRACTTRPRSRSGSSARARRPSGC
jgi:selenocysteine-specific elongation factor